MMWKGVMMFMLISVFIVWCFRFGIWNFMKLIVFCCGGCGFGVMFNRILFSLVLEILLMMV